MLAEILPGKAFHGKGANQGPSVVMIDDSSSKKGAFGSFGRNNNSYVHFSLFAMQMDVVT